MNSLNDIRIRPLGTEDASHLWEAVRESLAELQPWMPWCHPAYAMEESRAWLETQVAAFREGTAFEFAIVSANGQYLGGCGLNQVDKANHRANLGYWVRTSATNRGVAGRAVCLLRDWAFQNTNFVRLEIVIVVNNAASHRVAEKCGAIREGTLKNRLLLHGSAHDATMLSFAREMPNIVTTTR